METDLCVNGVYRFGAAMEYEIRVARDIGDRKAAWRFVRQAYVREGYASDCSPELWYGIHDALPSTTTFLLEKRGAVAATLTVVFDSAIGLPADGLYREELAALRSKNRRLSEIVSLVSEEQLHASKFKVIQHLFWLAFLVAHVVEGYTDFVITINPRHAAFYRRVMQFQAIGPERAYEKVSGALAVLLNLNLATSRAVYCERFGHLPGDLNLYRFFFEQNTDEIVHWLARARGPLDESSLADCFLDNANIVAQASRRQLAYVAAAARGALTENVRNGASTGRLGARETQNTLGDVPFAEIGATRNNVGRL
jgi:hypothetical protein